MPFCTICGSTGFAPGPKGRLNKVLVSMYPPRWAYASFPYPRCNQCGSLERHRIARNVFDCIKIDDVFRTYRALQFSNDPVLCPQWFKSFELSLYGAQNSMDVQDIPRRSGTYDVVVCCHVIEHVPDHRTAIRSLIRVASNRGFLYLAYPNPRYLAITRDWGYSDSGRHGHYREIGRDFEKEYKVIIPNTFVFAVAGTDAVTGGSDLHYLITKSQFWRGRIKRMLGGSARSIQ
jgi:hypothetical protein